MKALTLSISLITAASAQSSLQVVSGLFTNLAAQRVIALPNGNHAVIGVQTVAGPSDAAGLTTTRSAIFLYSISPTGVPDPDLGPPFPQTIGGSGNDVVADAATDTHGNIWIIGATDSDDFPLVHALVSQKVAYRTSGFVIELDPTGHNILFSSYLGGHNASTSQLFSKATNIAIGASGNVYILGNTSEQDFPTTPGVFGTPASLVNNFYGQIYSWVMSISTDRAMQYGSFLGGSQSNCPGGNGCVSILARNIGQAISVDAVGNVTVSGVTSASDFPTTTGAYQVECECIQANFEGFIARIAPDASHLVWSTYFGGPYVGDAPNLLTATDSAGNVFALGRSQPASTTENPLDLQPELFAAKVRSDGTGLVYMTDLGQSTDARVAGVLVGSDGNAFLAGTDSSPQFPMLSNVPPLGSDFVLELDPAGAHPQILYRLLNGTVTQPPAIDGNGNLLLLSAQGSVLELSGTAPLSQPGIWGLANSAVSTMSTRFAPGELVSLYGIGIGPAQAVVATPSAAGFPPQLGGVQVTVDGVSAPLLYVGANQINLQVPFESPLGTSLYAEIEVDGPFGKLNLQANAIPSLGLFYSGAPPDAAALNQDGSVNSAANPAGAGSVVSLFGTGALLSGVDGTVAPDATTLSQQANHLQAFDGYGNALTILYAGSAPGLIDGVFQINVLLPPNPSPLLTLQSVTAFGTQSSNTVHIYLK
jgi:uncharacterized protein (TIGR03437 family)